MVVQQHCGGYQHPACATNASYCMAAAPVTAAWAAWWCSCCFTRTLHCPHAKTRPAESQPGRSSGTLGGVTIPHSLCASQQLQLPVRLTTTAAVETSKRNVAQPKGRETPAGWPCYSNLTLKPILPTHFSNCCGTPKSQGTACHCRPGPRTVPPATQHHRCTCMHAYH